MLFVPPIYFLHLSTNPTRFSPSFHGVVFILLTLFKMVKRFNGFDFWEQRFRAQQSLSSGSSSSSDSDSDSESECSPMETPDVSTIDKISLATEQNPSSQNNKSTNQIVRSQPIIIKTVAAVHDVRNSLSFSPSLDHHSQSASVLLSSSYDEKEEFLTVIKRNDSHNKRNIPTIDTRRSGSGTPLRRRSPLKIDTTNLSAGPRRQVQQRHSTLPKLPSSDKYNITPEHRHTFNASSDCTTCLTQQTDKAFEALADALREKRRDRKTPTIHLISGKDFDVPVIRSPKPIRPKIISQHLERAQQWAESQQDFDSLTVSSLSSPMSPMMPISLSVDTEKSPVKTEIIPMGCNLDHDLGDFLKWEAKHVCAYGYGTNGFAISP
jgi:cytoskeletal protein RodZ